MTKIFSCRKFLRTQYSMCTYCSSSVHFGSFQLSADGSHLLYIAEREKPESCSFFKKPSDEAPIQVCNVGLIVVPCAILVESSFSVGNI